MALNRSFADRFIFLIALSSPDLLRAQVPVAAPPPGNPQIEQRITKLLVLASG